MFNVDDFEGDLNALEYQHNCWLGSVIHQLGALPDPEAPALKALELDAAHAGEPAPKVIYELGASFQVFCLDADVVQSNASDGRDLSELVRDTRRRHHQLKLNGEAVAYSRTLTDKNDEICQLWVTEIADEIQQALEWLKDYEKEDREYAAADPLVRLLRVPSFGIFAFWIQRANEPSDVLMISPRNSESLPLERLLNTERFLSGIRSTVSKATLIGPFEDLNDQN